VKDRKDALKDSLDILCAECQQPSRKRFVLLATLEQQMLRFFSNCDFETSTL
jgi:hypothetical protein